MKLTRLWAAAALACGPALGTDLQLASLRDMSLTDMLEVDLGTGTNKFLHQAPAVAYVITHADIARLGARNVLEVLESVPGMFLYNARAEIREPVTDMRGGFSERGGHVLYLLDGRPMRLLDGVASPEILRLPVAMVERIEVVRGPASAIYGADALTGAVNIITKKAPNEAGVGAGSSRQRSAWAGKSGKTGLLGWSVSSSYARADEELPSLNARAKRNYVLDFDRTYHDTSVKLDVGPVSFNLWALDYERTDTGDVFNPRPYARVLARHRHGELDYNGTLDNGAALKASLVHTEMNQSAENLVHNGAPTSGNTMETHDSVELSATHTLGEHRLRLAGGVIHDRRKPLQGPGGPANAVREISFLAMQDEWRLAANWELTAGVRVDKYSDIGIVRNPRLGLVWNSSAQLTTKLLWGQAFKAPSFSGNGDTPNEPPVAKPENLSNTELAFDYRPNEQLRLALNLYRYRARELFVGGPPGTPAAKRDGNGGELELSWLVSPSLRFESSLTAASVKDVASGVQVPFTPKRSGKLSMDWGWAPSWAMNLRWEGYFDRASAKNDARPPFGSLHIVNAMLRHDVNNSSTLALGVHNLLNNHAMLPVLNAGNTDEMQLPARSAQLQYELRF